MNTPNHPDESNEGRVPPHRNDAQQEPLEGNPYATQRPQQPPPDPDAGAPTLRAADVRSMNRRALVFLAGIVALLLVAGFLILRSGRNQAPPPKRQTEEAVSVPKAPAPPPSMVAAPPPLPKLPEPIALAPTPTPTAPQQQPRPYRQPEGPRGPSLMERRMMTGDAAAQGVAQGGGYGGQMQPAGGPMGGFGGMGFPGAPPYNGVDAVPPNSAYNAGKLPDVSSAQPLTHPDTLMLRGTFIRCVLETRIITDIPGFTSCVVTEPVYSFTGKRLLLPKGSRVLGKYEMEPNGPRVAVIWDRIVTPTGIDVNMASPGVDTLGGAGHPGYYNAHWTSRIGSALLISLLSDAFKYEAAEHGPKQTTISNGIVTQNPFESNTAQTLQNLSNMAVRRAANRPATVTINQGTVLAVYVAKDVDFAGVVARY